MGPRLFFVGVLCTLVSTFHVMQMTVPAPRDFSIDEMGHGLLKPVGETTLNAVVQSIDNAIGYCRDNDIACLLVDVRDATGFPSPSIAERFEFISRWAETAEAKVVVSIVARQEMILPDKFGKLVAANRGMVSDVFTDTAEAMAWLKQACLRHRLPWKPT